MGQASEWAGRWVVQDFRCMVCLTLHLSVHPCCCKEIQCPKCGMMSPVFQNN